MSRLAPVYGTHGDGGHFTHFSALRPCTGSPGTRKRKRTSHHLDSLRSTKQVWLVVVEQWPCCRMKNAPLQNAPCALGGSAVATITIAAKADERSAGPGERTDAPLPEGGEEVALC